MRTSTAALIPIPAKITSRTGTFSLTASTQIEASDALRARAEGLRDELRPATGFPLPIVTRASGSRITLALDEAVARLGDEAYRLNVAGDAVVITAARPVGVTHGTQTLRQLLPPAIFRRSVVSDVPWTVPGVEIEDMPRFSWRGSHLDVGRHFMPKATVLRHIDLLALHKLSVFHWHLTEDQGWRIEIKKYPKLTEVGAWRKDSMVPPLTRDPAQRKFAGVPHGGFYTQDDVREVVRYAADRGITVVPEIEMPGHASPRSRRIPSSGAPAPHTRSRRIGVSPNTSSAWATTS